MSSEHFEYEQYPIAPINVGARFLSGYAFKSQDFGAVGVPVIKIKNIQNRLVSIADSQHVPPQLVTGKLAKFVLKNGDVLIAMTGQGSVGRVGRLQCFSHQRPVMNQRVGKFLADEIHLNKDYLYYVISSDMLEKQLFALGSGSGQPNLSPETILSVEIPFPPYPKQVEIAEILNALDDRITLLRETNATLEAIAQALFKSWFVDFDPVRANIARHSREGGNPDAKGSSDALDSRLRENDGTVLDDATARLFPDGFEASELGLVPRGWRVQSFRETIHIIGGGTPKTSNPDFWSGDIPWFSVVDAPATSDVFVVDTEKHITEAGLNGSSTKLLPTGTTIISARGTVGRLALTGCPMTMNQSCYGLRGLAGDSYFTYFSTKRLVEQLKQRAHGSVFDTITQESFTGVLMCFPSESSIAAFEGNIEPLMLRVRENLIQAQTLATLRDTLLPRLISGQLRLPEVERMIKESAV
jgi:type I restriction enzyme S subunit